MSLLKEYLSFVVFLSILLVFSSNPCNALDSNTSFMDLESSVRELRSLIDSNSPGIVSIAVYDDTGAQIGNGSGFFVDREGRIITNASIWDNAYSAEVLSDLNSYKEVILLGRDEELDVALIKVKAAAREVSLEMDPNYKASLGERVIVIGKSANLRNTVSEGLISSFHKNEQNLTSLEIKTTASILPYEISKDGPVFNTAGKVIGITSRKITPEDPLREFNSEQMYAITLNPVRHVLFDSSQNEHLHPAKSKIWLKWLVSSFKAKTLKGFVQLYNLGSMKIITVFIGFILAVYIIKEIYQKFKKLKVDR